jgi:hypothetical protein
MTHRCYYLREDLKIKTFALLWLLKLVKIFVLSRERARKFPAMAPGFGKTLAEPSETSPLLSKPTHGSYPIDPSGGVGPEGSHVPGANEQDGGDIEQQVSNGDNSKHVGLPDVRKRMKYIFPAIAIGVSEAFNRIYEFLN